MLRRRLSVVIVLAALRSLLPPPAAALNPAKNLTQYTRTVWKQEDGLPQDTIRAIVQTPDGYLWLGTDEGLARFDGYEFVIFNKDNGDLPSNSISALATSGDGALWIGTPSGLTRYQNKRFHTFTTRDGLPDDSIAALKPDLSGAVWIVAGIYLSRFDGRRFSNFAPGRDLPLSTVRSICLDADHNVWVAGNGGVARLADHKFISMLDSAAVEGYTVIGLLRDREQNLWMASTQGLFMLSAAGHIRKYDARDGLPDPFVRSLWEDRDGNIWAGTNGGLSRLEHGRFVAPAVDSSRNQDWVRSIYEDREGNLWVGMNSGLTRFRDDIFTVYSKTAGLPSDEPTTVYQDREGRVWVGFHDAGLGTFDNGGFKVYNTASGLPSNEVFSIREDRQGDLLVATRQGLARMHGGHLTTYMPAPLARRLVFDTLADSHGRLWVAGSGGLGELRGSAFHQVIPGGLVLNSATVVLCEGSGGLVWAGTYGQGLRRIDGNHIQSFTTADGLSSDQIRSLVQDADGTLWIGTFGGGLNALRGGRFIHFTSKNGLLSDNISHVEDDGRGSLWLSTTRGICRISKRQLDDFAAGRMRALTPVNYGVEDGLRSAQCAPGYPTSGGGHRTSDGRLWFPTSDGLAVLDPNTGKRQIQPPVIHVVALMADGRQVDVSRPARLEPSSGRVEFRYTGIHLSAPERVSYSYRLKGLDPDWVPAGARRVTNYNSLPHGRYQFTVKAEVAGGPSSQTSYAFELLPHAYETWWFRVLSALLLAGTAWAVYQLRLRQVHSRFALVLEERARLAREIHDTLAQGFVGISSQLDAVAMSLERDRQAATQYLDLARKMARHSLTEARRSVMDLRASALEGRDLATALKTGTRQWTAGSSVEVHLEVGAQQNALPEEMEQHLLRIAQEAVTNVLKHAGARQIRVRLHTEARKLYLRIVDDGQGFEEQDVFSARGGHFGLIGMRERAERLGGELHLNSQPGHGTQVEVTVPLP